MRRGREHRGQKQTAKLNAWFSFRNRAYPAFDYQRERGNQKSNRDRSGDGMRNTSMMLK